MKKKIILMLAAVMAGAGNVSAQKTITIQGKVKFPDKEYKWDMEITRHVGFDRKTYMSVPVNEDGTYLFKFRVDEPGAYTLDCQKHERVEFWAENEDLTIDFRGMDTARIRIIGPTYAHIYGGPDNDLMNMVNWESYRTYWTGANMANAPYKEKRITDDALKQEMSGMLHSMVGDDFYERIYHIATYYADCNSAVTLLPMLGRNKELYDDLMARLEARNPDYGPLVKYKEDMARAKALRDRLAPGNPAPEFAYATPDGKRDLGPADFKGKFLVIDFWASWCGPCRAEIPHLKEAYEAYRDKGVEILSVSIDKDDNAWRKAMSDEGMPWPQVKAPDTGKEAMQMYQFRGIPHIVVIDREGNLVGSNYRGKALMDKLEELTSGRTEKARSVPMMGM